jgi:hypothetical protein
MKWFVTMNLTNVSAHVFMLHSMLSNGPVVKARDAYKYLHDWVDAKELDDTSVSIGPKGSYFARCGSKWISHGLPKDLMTKLDRNKDQFTPIHIALGLHGSWIVLWSDGDLSYNLRNSYPLLGESKALSGAVGQVVFVALNPYEEDMYFVAGTDGVCINVSLASSSECEELQNMTDNYMRKWAKRENATFNYPVKINGMTQNVYVTPTTFQRRTADSILETFKMRRSMLIQKDNMALIGAGTVAAGVASRITGAGPLKATGIATATGMGLAVVMLYGIRNGLRLSQ